MSRARSASDAGGGAFGQRSAAQRRVLQGRGDERLVERADVGAGRDGTQSEVVASTRDGDDGR